MQLMIVMFIIIASQISGCTAVDVNQEKLDLPLLLSSNAEINWQKKFDCMYLDPLTNEIVTLGENIVIPCVEFLAPSLVRIDTTTGDISGRSNYNNIFKLWNSDSLLYIIHGDTTFSVVDSNNNVIREYVTTNRNMRSGFPHNEIYYVFTEEDFRFDEFSMIEMEVVLKNASEIVIDETELWKLSNIDHQVILFDLQSHEEFVIGNDTFISGIILGNDIWVWSSQGKLYKFDAITKVITWDINVDQGEYFIDDRYLVTYQGDLLTVRDVSSLIQLGEAKLALTDLEGVESAPEIYALAVIKDQIVIVYNETYIASISWSK